MTAGELIRCLLIKLNLQLISKKISFANFHHNANVALNTPSISLFPQGWLHLLIKIPQKRKRVKSRVRVRMWHSLSLGKCSSKADHHHSMIAMFVSLIMRTTTHTIHRYTHTHTRGPVSSQASSNCGCYHSQYFAAFVVIIEKHSLPTKQTTNTKNNTQHKQRCQLA